MNSTDKLLLSAYEVSLREIARIQPGYLSRTGVRSVPNGTHFFIQAKDISPHSGIHLEEAARFRPRRKAELYLISKGDILVTARGQDHRAYLVTEDLENTLASSVFYILRSSTDAVRPAYLAWWLNLPDVQAEIKANSQGTGIGYINRQDLEQLTVPVPQLEIQKRIERIVVLWRKQKSLQAQLDQKREQLIQAVCRQAVRKTEE